MTQNGQNHHPALSGADTATVITNGTVTHRTTDPGLPVRHTGLPPEARKGALIDSAVTSFGSRRTGSDITEKDIVNIGGLDMSIKAALMGGLVVRNHDGSYQVAEKKAGDVNKEQAKGEDKDPRQAASDPQSMATLDSDMETQITEVATKANPGDVMGTIQAYTKDGSINDAALGRIASSMGVEPDHVRGQFEALRGAFTQQAHDTVAHTGLDPETVFEWARQNDLKSLQDAISTQATERSVRGYQKVARNYISSLDTSNPEAILGAQLGDGIQARRDSSTGNIVLNIKGEDVSWKTAIRRGMIKIGKGN